MAATLKVIASVAFIANAAANIYAPPASTIYTIIKHIHICNVTTSACWFTLYIGATGASTAGTEIFKQYNVSANGVFDYFTNRLMVSTAFLVGVAQTASALTIDIEGEQGVV